MPAEVASAIHARLIAAMERRADGLEGAARDALETRLAALRQRAPEKPETAPGCQAGAPPPGPLRELLDRVAPPAHGAYPEVPALAEFRRLWSALRSEHQLEQSAAHTPTDAGPLNSTALATRAIALMRELSPDYLRAFLAYVDDLAWLEALAGAGTASAPGAAPAKKRSRRTPKG